MKVKAFVSKNTHVDEKYRCADCDKVHPTTCMLRNEVWKSIAAKDERLCFSCTEKRLGRRITLAELAPCGCTNAMFMGIYMYLREGGQVEFDQDFVADY